VVVVGQVFARADVALGFDEDAAVVVRRLAVRLARAVNEDVSGSCSR
jgi:hypothetical protein